MHQSHLQPTNNSSIQTPMAMAFNSFYARTLSVFLLLSFFTSISIADNSHAVVPPETVCHSTLDPSYCKFILASQNGSIYDYCHISVRKSLSQSRKFLNTMYSYLQNPSSLSQPTILALEDCQLLSELNFEYLSTTLDTVDKANVVLPTSQADDVHTLLSAVLTNQQTCLDGLQTSASDPRVKNGLSSQLSDDMKLNSVSLYLFTKAWVPENKIWQHHGAIQNDGLPLKMPNKVRAIYDSAKGQGRKLLQTSDDTESVVVSDIVVVSKDGSGNFTTINDAIAAAPNNTAVTDGYFVIIITEGVYQEYVSIAKNKKFLMLIGDGINRTIVTGDHNVVDGFTTFNSATFGKHNILNRYISIVMNVNIYVTSNILLK